MGLLLDLFLDGVCELVVYLATVPEIFFYLLLVIHLNIITIILFLLSLVTKSIDLSLLELFSVFVVFFLSLLFSLRKLLYF